MLRLTLSILSAFLLLFWNSNYFKSAQKPGKTIVVTPKDSLPNAKGWPEELDVTNFTSHDVTPSPACMAVAASGEVYVGVDMMGSLGKQPDKGSIVRLVDANHDGTMDKSTVFARVDNPRGIIAMDDKVYVLHTTFSAETKKASGMDLVVFEDKNQDGVADGGPQPLIQNICSPKFLQSRGTDHATNGIRMGIDGWIYIAVGDFGFHDAVDRSGKKMTMLGGGIVRVRPNGTEMEIYTHGMRNIYDVAIDPYMNVFTRDNTNDGGGWNIRFSNQIQSGEYGYPVLFKHFTNEIIPALIDLGGGSGTGSLFINDNRWPEEFNNQPLMADWGRNQLYVHRVEPDGPTFTQKEEEFIKLSQITDVDIDGAGTMYLSAWDGAGYSGNPGKGFVVRAVPKNWKYEQQPVFSKLSVAKLSDLLKAQNAVNRLAAQQELLSRPAAQTAAPVWKIAADQKAPLYNRVAALYTYSQITGASGTKNILTLVDDKDMKQYAIRAVTDRKGNLADVPTAPFVAALNDESPRVRTAATIALGRLGRAEAATALLKVPVPANFAPPAKDTEGPHATPNSAIVAPHLAVRALVSINAVDACVKAIGTENSALALWALKYMHDPKAVSGLIAAYDKTSDANTKNEIITTLSRLYLEEAPYDGSWWWSTRPDTHGPYYKGITWGSSDAIKAFLTKQFEKPGADKQFFADLNSRHRMEITEFGGDEKTVAKEEVKVDLEKIRNKKGQVGESSIEDVMLAMAKINGDPKIGKTLFTNQGCVACHSLSRTETMKGPFMGQIGSIMTREQIAESILKPNASISQGFASVLITAKGDKSYMGFVTEESAGKLVLRDITGQTYNIKVSDILSRKEMETSMMPTGLASALSYEEFASLITFLSQQKK